MSFEYHYEIDDTDSKALDTVLRQAPYFSEYNQGLKQYYFRKICLDPKLPPDITSSIKDYGLYIAAAFLSDSSQNSIMQEFLNYLQASGCKGSLEEM